MSVICRTLLVCILFGPALAQQAPYTVADGTFNRAQPDLGLQRALGTQTITVFAPDAKSDKFSNGAVLIPFKGRLYAQWQSSRQDEDSGRSTFIHGCKEQLMETPRIPGATDYVLGHSPGELQRLTLQSQFWGEATHEWLLRAGLAPGMRVLELGSGAGDVALLAASLVGESGSVLGIDRAPASIETATRRTQAAGVRNVSFRAGTAERLELEDRFDAVVGRLVLMYLADPAASLADIARRLLKPGGIVAFMEMDMEAARIVPDAPLVREVTGCLVETFRRAGNPVNLGSRLGQVFRDAGLPDAQLLPCVRLQAPPAIECTNYLAATIRSLLPMMEKTGVARAADLGIDTLAERMQQALTEANATLIVPMMVGAWTRLANGSAAAASPARSAPVPR